MRNKILANQETTYGFKALARLLDGGWCSRTILRWCTVGKRRQDKTVVRMEFVIGPAGRRSSVEAYRRFLAALNRTPRSY